MGEVGTNSNDGQDINIKMNGNLNGTCDDDEEERMEVDSHNESQESTDVQSSDGRAKKLITAVQNDVDDTEESSTNLSVSGKVKPNKHTDEEKDESTRQSDDGVDDTTQDTAESGTQNNENGSSKMDEDDAEHEDVSVDVSKVKESTSDEIIKSPDDKPENKVNNEELTEKSDTKIVGKADDENKSNVNGFEENSLDINEVHSISDSEDENMDGKKSDVKLINADDRKAVSNKTNGHESDKAFSIHSDSDDEPNKSSSNRVSGATKNGVSEVTTVIDSDKDEDDCVVIEDDKKDEELLPRRSSRTRKSVVKVRDFAAYDEDDIQEIDDDDDGDTDPLHTPNLPAGLQISKKPLEPPPLKQLTIQDARSLAVDPAKPSSSFQQQFMQQAGVTQKEPTLVIIDTNSILNRPVPVNQSRTSLTPIAGKQPPVLLPTTSTLLPALTDDMFVLEAPSFILPYIYEKPPTENLQEIVAKMRTELEEQRKKDEAENEGKIKDDPDDDEGDCLRNEIESEGEKAKAAAKSKSKSSKRKRAKNPDDSWDESDMSTDEDASDTEQRTKVLIKEASDLDAIKTHIISTESVKKNILGSDSKNKNNYFESPLGKFFIDIGIDLVQEHVQTDLLRQQKRKLHREGDKAAPSVQMAIGSLMKNLEMSKAKNDQYKFETKRCEFCNFKSESSLSMAHHYESPHIINNMYKCNFCKFESRAPYDILFHMEALHNIKARLERALSYHQCPNCPFEDNGKSKLSRHAAVCGKKFRPETNMCPPPDWEPPAKIPRIKPRHGLVGTANAYQAMAARAQSTANAAAAAAAANLQRQQVAAANAALIRARGAQIQPNLMGVNKRAMPGASPISMLRPNPASMRAANPMSGMILPNNFQITAAGQFMQANQKGGKGSGQPSISITPLPRGGIQSNSLLQSPIAAPGKAGAPAMKPGQSQNSKASFVICEICDGYIKDLDQLRNHMQWMHKVKIHPKMIYNRPPLNCQKCQFRFFTDQGLERHLLGSHGLVTSSMQDAANKGKDAGRCPICGRMYQWKLLNHVSRDHSMTLKPAHLSYKCTVCTATFGMYKQFENHVYSAHSTVAKKTVDNKRGSMPSSSKGIGSSMSTSGDSLLKPLKINDEITIIPQPASRLSKGSTITIE